jgi:hypothetical protein
MSEERIDEPRDFDLWFSFKSFGVRIAVGCDDEGMKRKLQVLVEEAFGESAEIFEGRSENCDYSFGCVHEDGLIVLYENGRSRSGGPSERNALKFLNSLMRLKVAELSEGRIFIHAGVIGWKGRAIVFPGTSFAGKSTLTAELVRNGAEYYSDEYAVVEKDGLIVPFPRHISLRYFGGKRARNVTAAELNGTQGKRPIPAGMVLFTQFEKKGSWDPELMTAGAGIMEIIPHIITMRRKPAFSLKVLDLMLRNAIIAKSPRGDVKKFAKFLLEFFENHTILAKVT